METNFSKMVKRQKNKLTKEKWDKNCGIWRKDENHTKKKNSIKEYEKREIMSPKNKIEITSTVDILMILLSLGIHGSLR